MRLFLLTFFVLYAGLHFYAFLKIRAAFTLSAAATALLLLFMLIMIAAPVIIRLSEKQGHETFAQIMAYVGYTWMGVLFLFCSASMVIDASRLLVSAGGFIMRKDISPLMPSGTLSFMIPLLLSLAIACYGYFEAKNIRTERIVIRTPKIPKDIGRLTIAQISDVHLGLIVREDRLGRILDEVKKANPDIFISTGDLVDGQLAKMNGLAGMLRAVNPRYGKFAITGNHEFYAGLDQALAFTRDAGFVILRGEAFSGIINIAGVDDTAGKAFKTYKEISDRELLSGLPKEKFTLFLKHRPLLDQDALPLFDLQLSGHVHKGQIFPFSILTYLYYPVHAGYSRLPWHAHLYVSRGSGTWGPPIRFLAPPEVTIIELVHAERG
ncbi:MAG: metallophosphoesterase [Nitrospirota bacterium]